MKLLGCLVCRVERAPGRPRMLKTVSGFSMHLLLVHGYRFYRRWTDLYNSWWCDFCQDYHAIRTGKHIRKNRTYREHADCGGLRVYSQMALLLPEAPHGPRKAPGALPADREAQEQGQIA